MNIAAVQSNVTTGEDLVAAARALAPSIRESAEAAEKARKIPVQVFNSIREAGILRILQPRRFGGFEFEPGIGAAVSMELAAACGSTGWVAACGISHSWIAAQFPLQCQEEIWADGADKLVVTSFTATGEAERVDGGYRLDGIWRYASGLDHGDFLLLGIRLPDESETDKTIPHFVIVPIADCETRDDWDTMGLAATGSNAAVLKDVFVPAHRAVPVPEIGAGTAPGRIAFETALGRMPLLSVGANCLAATVIGCFQGAFEAYTEHLKEWRTRGMVVGGGALVSDYPGIQMRVGRAGAALKAARTLLFSQLEHSRAMAFDEGRPLDAAERIENRSAQAYSIQLAR